MNTINDYFIHAQLSLIAYADLGVGVPRKDKLEMGDRGMSEAQAAQFIAQGWKVVDRHFDGTGLSATVFEDANGKTYLAIRGTEIADINDDLTNLVDIAILGTTDFQAQYASLKAKVEEWVGVGKLSQSFTVTGHSLGGFLDTGIVADFSDKVSHAYLYNTPGVGGIINTMFPFPILNALDIASSLDPAKISNLKSKAGISLIAGLGYQVSTSIPIEIEDQSKGDVDDPPLALNHSQQVLTDTLALYSVFSELALESTTDQIGEIFNGKRGWRELIIIPPSPFPGGPTSAIVQRRFGIGMGSVAS